MSHQQSFPGHGVYQVCISLTILCGSCSMCVAGVHSDRHLPHTHTHTHTHTYEAARLSLASTPMCLPPNSVRLTHPFVTVQRGLMHFLEQTKSIRRDWGMERGKKKQRYGEKYILYSDICTFKELLIHQAHLAHLFVLSSACLNISLNGTESQIVLEIPINP